MLKQTIEMPGCSWQEVHTLLRDNNVELRLRGNGLVFSSLTEKLLVKASAVDRAFTKAKLETHMGEFAPPELARATEQQIDSPRVAIAPQLYQLFQSRTEKNRIEKQVLYSDYRNKRSELYAVYRAKRNALKREKLSTPDKRKIASLLTIEYTTELEALRQSLQAARLKLSKLGRQERWIEFLISEVKMGNVDARKELQKSETKLHHKVEATITSLIQNEAILFRNYHYRVHRNGDITYRLSAGASFIDRGQTIELPTVNKTSVEAAITFAIQRFGSKLEVQGSEEFKAIVASVIEFRAPQVKVEWRRSERFSRRSVRSR